MPPLLPLDTFRRLMLLHPWHFWQLADNDVVPLTDQCSSLLYQASWQTPQFAGRDEIAEAIQAAEEKLRPYIKHSVAPEYREEIVPYPRHYNRGMGYAGPIDASGRWISVKVPNTAYIQALGVKSLAAIALNQAVTLSDLDNDGISETFTVGPIVTTVTDVKQIEVQFSSTERWDGSEAGDAWRVRPLRLTISGGQLTIKGPTWLIVKRGDRPGHRE
jgi:hypothetical protein